MNLLPKNADLEIELNKKENIKTERPLKSIRRLLQTEREREKGDRCKGDAGQGEGEEEKRTKSICWVGQYTFVSIGVLFSGHKSLKSGIEKVQRVEVGRGTAMPNAEHPLPCSPFCRVASNMKSAQMES